MKRPAFTRRPDIKDMVTEPCDPKGVDLLCVTCGWQGHTAGVSQTMTNNAFMSHQCKLRAESVSQGW